MLGYAHRQRVDTIAHSRSFKTGQLNASVVEYTSRYVRAETTGSISRGSLGTEYVLFEDEESTFGLVTGSETEGSGGSASNRVY